MRPIQMADRFRNVARHIRMQEWVGDIDNGKGRFHRRDPGSGRERDAVTAGTCHAVFTRQSASSRLAFRAKRVSQASCGVLRYEIRHVDRI